MTSPLAIMISIEVLKSPTFNVCGSMCDLRFNSVTFTDEGAFVFGEEMLRTERLS